MHMHVRIDIRGSMRTERVVEVEEGMDVISLLRSLTIRPDGVICFIAGTPVPLDRTLEEGEELTVVEAASGG